MPKEGILHDYDTHANLEGSAHGVTCAVCGSENIYFQWSDYSGEGMCMACGCPYQLKWGSEEEKAEGKYPYLNMRPEFVSIAKEFWEATKTWVYYGSGLGAKPGMKELVEWLKVHHPEQIKKE